MGTATTQAVISVNLTPEFKERALKSSWGMFTPEGSMRVADTFIALVEGGVVLQITSDGIVEDFGRAVFETIDAVVSPNHSEVNDTEVRGMIWSTAESLLK